MTIQSDPLVRLLEAKQTPDVICRELRMCKGYEHCQLFPGPQYRSFISSSNGEPWWVKIIEPFYKTFANHTAMIDMDKDGHSTVPTFRGTRWVGKDCNDHDGSIYPGRKQSTHQVCA
jgi:hypothetical protein